MNLLLVSERPAVVGEDAARTAVEELARTLAAADHSVTWLRPRLPEEPPLADLEGVRVLSEPSTAPPFGSVTGRLYDVPNEKLLVEELRLRPPDLVHVHGFGGTSSYLPPWFCERLGVPVLVVVRSIAAVLCARRAGCCASTSRALSGCATRGCRGARASASRLPQLSTPGSRSTGKC